MTFDIRPPGMAVDQQQIVGQVDTTPGGGELAYDEQRLQRRDPTSEVEWQWDGYTRRTLEVAIYPASRPPRGALDPYEALALLHRAHRGGGDEPNEHTVTGMLASALGFDIPWAITSVRPTEGMNLEIVIRMIELDPEAVSVGAAEVDPASDEPEPPAVPDPDDQVDDQLRQRILEYDELTGGDFIGPLPEGG